LRQSKSLVRVPQADHSITNKTRCARPFERRRYIKDSNLNRRISPRSSRTELLVGKPKRVI
jgi:hypothetical protein